MSRRILLAATLLIAGAAPAAAQGTLRAMEVDDLRDRSRPLHLDLHALLRRAERREADAVGALLHLAAYPTLVEGSRVYPAIVWSLLLRTGDSAFAQAVAAQLPLTRSRILLALDRGAGIVYARRFPESWALGAHAPELLQEPGPPPRPWGPRAMIATPADLPGGVAISERSCLPRPGAYPSRLARAGVSGRVVIGLDLNRAGRAVATTLHVLSATHSDLVGPARRALLDCIFAPARVNGQAVPVRLWVPVAFHPDLVALPWPAAALVRPTGMHWRAASLGVDLPLEARTAALGDTAALRELLRVAPAMDEDPNWGYARLLHALRRTTGDSLLQATIDGLPTPAREVARRMTAAFPTPARDSSGTAAPTMVPGSCAPLRYPPDQREAGGSGRVLLELTVAADGTVDADSIRVVEATHPSFARAARDVLATCRYHPGRERGVPVPMRVAVPISFTAL